MLLYFSGRATFASPGPHGPYKQTGKGRFNRQRTDKCQILAKSYCQHYCPCRQLFVYKERYNGVLSYRPTLFVVVWQLVAVAGWQITNHLNSFPGPRLGPTWGARSSVHKHWGQLLFTFIDSNWRYKSIIRERAWKGRFAFFTDCFGCNGKDVTNGNIVEHRSGPCSAAVQNRLLFSSDTDTLSRPAAS